MTTASVEGGRIVLRAPFRLKELCKSIPARQWSPKLKAWTYPASPATARTIAARFPDCSFGSDVVQLLVRADQRDAAATARDDDDPPPIPITVTDPWDHQLRAYNFAKDLDATMLAMWMGTGKSKVTIDLFRNREHEAVLIACPKPVMRVWPTQFETHGGDHFAVLPLDGLPTDGGTRKTPTSVAKRAAQAHDWCEAMRRRGRPHALVVNYEAMWQGDLAKFLLGREWDGMSCDESHKIKKPGGKASRFAHKIASRVRHRIAASGTPMAHSPLDVYGQYRYLDEGIFGTSYAMFRNRFAIMGGYQANVRGTKQPVQVVGFQNERELNELFYSIAYRCGKDVLDLPPTTNADRYCELGPQARRMYDEMDREFIAEVRDGFVTADNALVKLLRLRQMAGGFAVVDYVDSRGVERQRFELVDDAKERLAAEVFEEIGRDDQIIALAEFHHELDALHRAAEAFGASTCEQSGRRKELDDWVDGKAQILVGQISACSTGLNELVAAHYTYYHTTGTSLVEFLQSQERTHRPGQKADCVHYVYGMARNTKDKTIRDNLEKRNDVIEAILSEAMAA